MAQPVVCLRNESIITMVCNFSDLEVLLSYISLVKSMIKLGLSIHVILIRFILNNILDRR